MSVTGRSGVGIPTILLHESESLVVTVELKDGTMYRGVMGETEDNWNILLKSATCTKSDGKVVMMESVYIKGGSILFIIMPDFVSKSPMFQRIRNYKKGIKTLTTESGRARALLTRDLGKPDRRDGGGGGRGR
jgi:small nuclear ribonucleoprotein D3